MWSFSNVEVSNRHGSLRAQRRSANCERKHRVKKYDETRPCHELEDGWSCHQFEDHQPYHCRDCSCSWCDRCRCCRCKCRINLQGYVVLANATVEILHALLNNLCALSCSDRCCRLLDGIPTNCCVAHVFLACLRRIRLCSPIHPSPRQNYQVQPTSFFTVFKTLVLDPALIDGFVSMFLGFSDCLMCQVTVLMCIRTATTTTAPTILPQHK